MLPVTSSANYPHKGDGDEKDITAPNVTSTPTSSAPQIKRPPNAFIIFTIKKRKELTEPNGRMNDINAELGSVWRGMTNEEKAPYFEEAAKLKADHLEKYPDCQYKSRKKSKPKRKSQARQSPPAYKLPTYQPPLVAQTTPATNPLNFIFNSPGLNASHQLATSDATNFQRAVAGHAASGVNLATHPQALFTSNQAGQQFIPGQMNLGFQFNWMNNQPGTSGATRTSSSSQNPPLAWSGNTPTEDNTSSTGPNYESDALNYLKRL